jgi:hypothetical protein
MQQNRIVLSSHLIVHSGDTNPRLQAKGRVDEVALCDDIDSAVTQSTTSRSTWCGVPSTASGCLTGPVATRVRDLLRQIAATDELIKEYINEQEGEPVHEDDGRFQIDPT